MKDPDPARSRGGYKREDFLTTLTRIVRDNEDTDFAEAFLGISRAEALAIVKDSCGSTH